MKKKDKRIIEAVYLPKKDLFVSFARMLMAIGFFTIFMSYIPSTYYAGLEVLGINISNRVLKDTTENLDVPLSRDFTPYQPQYDPDLPSENTVIIPSIRLSTPINEAADSDFEDALQKGVWRVSDFGNPHARSLPTILVAHRFGYLKWSISYRLKNSFFNLPKTEIGDRVEVVWDRRKYVYEIFKEEEGFDITDYSADLILYTCKDMTSDIKVFRYAKLLEI